ncbi:beta-1,4-N-acetylgalactosaminyltransferase bre-4-like [Zerene cesonia]|uniref:beta-1,4-N-acetylgalactosaminyltransferase bre-4-like n=1 Tax=Zerene cesonia TaxID=33412 RepID=UPI0018E503FF|nr:beta-1,4-N-acetylgalactosaminyltransferase bre-4-like [Zerene cesonia]
MLKWLSLNRLQKLRVSNYIIVILCLIAIIQLFAYYGYYEYDYIPKEDIDKYLYKHVNPNLVRKSKLDCDYASIYEKVFPDNWDVGKQVNEFTPSGIANGSFVPEECHPLFSVAILVTYRNRQSQLDVFIPFIHNFLKKQKIHYKVYIIEQQDDKPFNKGLLYNIGAKQAIADKFPCLIHHDVDLLPLNAANLYVCLQQPRHMSAIIDKFRFVLPYKTLVGGVLAIRSDQYVELNGFSNKFKGWGGEDDEFAARIKKHNYDILRFPPDISRYTMLVHKQEPKNIDRHHIMAHTKPARDGFASPANHLASLHTHPLFTRITVKT